MILEFFYKTSINIDRSNKTVTVTVKDFNGVPLQNKTVPTSIINGVFTKYNNTTNLNNVVEYTGTTDSNGVFQLTYNPSSQGLIRVQANECSREVYYNGLVDYMSVTPFTGETVKVSVKYDDKFVYVYVTGVTSIQGTPKVLATITDLELKPMKPVTTSQHYGDTARVDVRENGEIRAKLCKSGTWSDPSFNLMLFYPRQDNGLNII